MKALTLLAVTLTMLTGCPAPPTRTIEGRVVIPPDAQADVDAQRTAVLVRLKAIGKKELGALFARACALKKAKPPRRRRPAS